MRFLNPAGLWLLLGIPILIIIYLIKSKYEERTVSSTYIWKLSERFMKKRLPLQKIRTILLFVMQLILIAAAALIVSRPVIVNGEKKTYIAIIDASASMQTKDETGTSRFDYAIEEVRKLTDEMKKGHEVSVLLASDKATYVLQNSSSKNELKRALEDLDCAQGGCNVDAALELVQLECDRNPEAEVLFYTDCEYAETEQIHVFNLHKNEWNVSMDSLTSIVEGENTVFTGQVTSHYEDKKVVVGLKVNEKVVDAKTVSCEKGVPTEVSFTREHITAYETAEIYIEVADGLSLDNRFVLCQEKEQTHDVLLVSQSPLYLEKILNSLGNCEVSVVKDISVAELSNFDLYIFDGIAPKKYPTDGAVLIFGTALLPEGLKAEKAVEAAESLATDNSLQSEVYEGLTLVDTMVVNYAPLTGGKDWTPLLYCGENAVFMTKKQESGLRISLMSFDIHDSNLPMQEEFGVLMRNLVNFSIPSLLKEREYSVGDSVQVSVLPGAKKLSVELPDLSKETLSMTKDQAVFVPEEVGVYTVELEKAGPGETASFFVHISEEEAAFESSAVLKLQKAEALKEKKDDALTEVWFWIAAVMLLILLLEWGWYYREQY